MLCLSKASVHGLACYFVEYLKVGGNCWAPHVIYPPILFLPRPASEKGIDCRVVIAFLGSQTQGACWRRIAAPVGPYPFKQGFVAQRGEESGHSEVQDLSADQPLAITIEHHTLCSILVAFFHYLSNPLDSSTIM